VHADGRNEGPFLTDWLVARYPEMKDVGEVQRSSEGEVLDRPGIVHRLDKETSGVILVAKTPEAHAFFKGQFQNREVSKKYLAFVWGEMKESFGTITRPIGRSFKTGPKWSAQRGARGEMREAETYWTKLWAGAVDGQKFSLIQAEPKTGRTHQIRVHFLAIQHPVVSDMMYAPKKPLMLGFDRLALHSWKLRFKARSGKETEITAPLPADFAAAVADLGIKLK
jgi:23S rRNA pseudouridine1911/1915/1917 synthase